MQGQDLTYEQLQKLKTTLAPKLRYVRKLRTRMVQTGFPPHDRMFRDVQIVEAALHDLLAEIETVMSYRHPTPEAFR